MDPFGRRRQLAEYEHICAVQQRLLQITEHLVTEVQWLRNRAERTDGRAERLEYALEAFLDWLAAQRSDAPPPTYRRTQRDIHDLAAWRDRQEIADG